MKKLSCFLFVKLLKMLVMTSWASDRWEQIKTITDLVIQITPPRRKNHGSVNKITNKKIICMRNKK